MCEHDNNICFCENEPLRIPRGKPQSAFEKLINNYKKKADEEIPEQKNKSEIVKKQIRDTVE